MPRGVWTKQNEKRNTLKLELYWVQENVPVPVRRGRLVEGLEEDGAGLGAA